ncbi:MAG TPA: FKBP-type peptidyl-prolyl cis-trans isomerase [Pirellulales bacterium]|nr:FKBP-type peptidyl-prolyl cis-trans isomerase [Pirellulales bacterium]
MNRKLVLGVVVGLIAAQLWAQEKQPKKIELKSTADRAAYAFGAFHAMQIHDHFETEGVPLDKDVLLRGFREALSGGKMALSEEEMGAAIQAMQDEVAKRNADEGENFLANNKKKKDVVTTPSGLQYRILKKGMGKSPTVRDVVTVNYRGKFLNGKEFDSSYARKEPLSIAVARTIEGWREALPQMQVGSKWELYVPSDLAYGPTGNGGSFPPNAMLVFEVELLDIAKAEAAAPRTKPQSVEDLK